MATLEKIRSRGVLLMIIIGVALIAFIVGDFVRNPSQDTSMGKINGEKIKREQFQEAVDQYISAYEIENNTKADENITAQIRQATWDQLIRQQLVAEEAEKIGLAVSQKELEDMTVGEKPHSMIAGRRLFMNEAGQFDKNLVVELLKELQKKPTSGEEQERFNKLKNYWMYFENAVKTGKLEEKYNTLLSRTLKANSVEAKMAFDAKKSTTDLLYVQIPYTSIPDAKVSVSEKEIADKYNSTKELYKQPEETREIKFVSFDIKPSPEDFKSTEEAINALKDEFATSNDVKLVVNKAGSRPYQDIAMAKRDIDPDLSNFAFSGKAGDVFGPTLFGNTYKMARIMASGIASPDSFDVRHIVVFYENDTVKTKTVADSILNALRGGANFGQLAMKYSKFQTARQGGELGWVTEASVSNVPNLGKLLVSTPVNTFFTYKDGQATQIWEITKKTANVPKVKLAVISIETIPSKTTYNNIFTKAKEFATAATSQEMFEKTAQKSGYMIQSSPELEANTPNLFNLKNSRQIVRWAFDNEKGSISDVFPLDNVFMVAELTDVNPKGYRSLEKITPEIKSELMNEKKSALILSDLKSKNTSDLQTLATQMSVKVDTAMQVNFESSSFGNVGFEPKVIAAVNNAELNKTYKPIAGKNGVYVFEAIKRYDNPLPFNEKMEKNQLTMRYGYAVYTAIEALKDKAEIKDNRYSFY